MKVTSIKGNICELPEIVYAEAEESRFHTWIIGDIGENIAFWVLHQAKFWRIVKPFQIQYSVGDEIINISSFICPNQVRHGLCLLPNEDEHYYKEKILTEEQLKLTYRWDFLALKIQKEQDRFEASPCLIDVKIQKDKSGTCFNDSEYYKIFKKKCDASAKEKEAGFTLYCLRIVLEPNWQFEAVLTEL